MTRRATRAPVDTTEYSQSPSWVFALFSLFVLFFYLQGGYRFPVLGSIRFELIIGSILAALAAGRLMGRPTLPGERQTAIPHWVIAVLVVSLTMTFFSKTPSLSFDVFVDRVLKLMLMALFIRAFVDSPTRLRWFLIIYLFAFLKMAQEGILGLATGSLIWENQGVPRLHGSTPNYAHPNSFSGTQLGTLPLLLALLPIVGIRWRSLVALQIVAATTIVITTGSRTGYVALLIWGVISIWKSKARARNLALALTAVAIASAFVPRDYFDRFESIFTQEDKEGQSIGMRKEILEDAWAIFSDAPLGVGVGAFSEVRMQTFGRSQPTHNLFLEVACDMGVQGLIAFIGLLFCLLLCARRLLADSEKQLSALPPPEATATWPPPRAAALAAHRSDLQFIRAAARGVYGLLVIRIGLGLFGHDFYEIYWWFAAGLLLALNNILTTATRRSLTFAEAVSDGTQDAAQTGSQAPRLAVAR